MTPGEPGSMITLEFYPYRIVTNGQGLFAIERRQEWSFGGGGSWKLVRGPDGQALVFSNQHDAKKHIDGIIGPAVAGQWTPVESTEAK